MKASLMRYGFRVILGLTLWGFGCPSPAEAAEPPVEPTTKKPRSDAVKFFEDGVKAAKATQWKEAHEAFLAAWKLKQHWQIAANLGRSELMLGKHREAAEHLSYFLREAKELGENDRRQAEEMLAKARTGVGMVTVRVDLVNADVFIDGKPVGRAPLTVFVDPGRRILEARREGYAPIRTTIDVTAGSSPEVKLELRKASEVRSTPLTVEAESTGGPRKSILYAGITATSTATAAGIAFAIASQVKANESNVYQGGPNQIGDADRQQQLQRVRVTLAELSLWSFIGAGALASGTLAYVIVAQPKPKSATASTFQFSVEGVGVAFTASW